MEEKAKIKLIKVSTVPTSLNTFCRGQLAMLSEHYEVVAVSSPLKELNEIREREKVKCIPVAMERHISIKKDIRSLREMIKVFKAEKPYIVHSMTPKAGLISMLAAWITRVPVRMHTYTGLVFPTAHGVKKLILILMDKLLCACATYINPEGFGVANDLSKITQKPLHIIGHGNVRGIDLDYWNRDKALQVSDELRAKLQGRFVFMFVGRLVTDKGINELVRAFKNLQAECTEKPVLLLVGHYEEKLDSLDQETLDEISANPDIITVGEVSDVRPYYNVSDVFVFPSYREGLPNTVLEAGAMGLPQIVTDINGCNEIIKNNWNGIIIPPRRVDDLQKAMRTLMNDDKKREFLVRNAREMVASRYEQKYIWQELLKTYDKLVSRK